MAKDRFSKDIKFLLRSLETSADSKTMNQLQAIALHLIELRKKRLVKINHSVMQVLAAKELIEQGYNVKIEYPLDEGRLIADIFAVRKRSKETPLVPKDQWICEQHGLSEETETLVLEVETGFVPPKAALYPVKYRQIRIAAKIARYSGHSHIFALATPSFHVLQIPAILLKPPDLRDASELQELKSVCDTQYKSPPIIYKTLASAIIDNIYIINVDKEFVSQVAPSRYLDTILRAQGVLPGTL